MKGNFQVRFLEGGGLATARLHSTRFTSMGNRLVWRRPISSRKHAALRITAK